ncbi:Aste57867_24610 [Aphanomyces stellatus]|uniref:Aste57867_24610 protein n=1 Tax=Aphanomyces stellatus TaxID=120398 RepID=A0A485LQU0_9STRA|nr:hypothetical protein As57867_024532 [Aphanomyces stellatus]VFU01248.1 Aste57867_24610 [Aphanomyces stellatus]
MLRSNADRTAYGSMPMAVHLKRTNAWWTKALPVAVGSLAAFSVGACVVLTNTSSFSSVTPSKLAVPTSHQQPPTDVICIETSPDNGHLTTAIAHASLSKTDTASGGSVIAIDESKTFQDIVGFGGAFTEASALQFQRLPREKQDDLLRLYFDEATGAAYSVGRVPMNSCDFSPATYSFADVENDFSLDHFDMSVEHDTAAIIPFIQSALRLRTDMKLFLSPWSPPAWMKFPDAQGERTMLGSASPYGLHPDFRSSWALYFSKFISAYKAHGIPFWGLTPQNEPQQPAPWEACLYDDAYQAEFISSFLGPRIRRDHPHMKILIFDHNRGNVHLWAHGVYNHSTAIDFVDGVAFHWYDNTRDLDGVQNHEHVNDTYHLNPTKFLLATEAANCPGVATGTDAWRRGQRYAHDILADLAHYAGGWVDWNLLLDHTGGPNKLGNTCDAPVILTPDGADFTVQPMYYFIKHFSAYIPPGSTRLATHVHVQYDTPGDDVRLNPRFPGGAYACDGSSRQLIRRTDDSKLQINGTRFCFDVVPEPWLGDRVEIVECQYTTNSWDFKPDDQTIQFADQCLSHSRGVLGNGGRLTLEPCSGSDHQQWSFDGLALKNERSQHCVTGGYAFAQAVAFKTPRGDKVLVVLNENNVDATFRIDAVGGQVETVVPRDSIRTYVWA